MSNKNVVIGIDLGTTNSCVSYVENGQPKIINVLGKNTMPSYVAFNKDGDMVVGDLAKRQPPSENILYEVKRLIGRKYDECDVIRKHVSYKIIKADNGDAWVEAKGKKYSPSQIGAFVLTELKKTAEEYLNCKITQAVITVPAYFNNSQRQAVKDAGKIAGLDVLQIINEPTAAALAYGLDKDQSREKKIAVYDLGGGTFDVSILEISEGVFEVKSTNGDTMLGGADFDTKIISYILKGYKDKYGVELTDPIALQMVRTKAEEAKIELTSVAQVEINLPYLGFDEELKVPKSLSVTLTRAQFENICYELIKRSIDPCKIALKDAGYSLGDIDDVVLVGGMTRMPKVVEVVREFFGKDPHKGVNPDEVVAQGAAIQGAVLSGDSNFDSIQLLDVTPLTLGIETMGGVLTPLIEKNTTIPYKKSQVFSTAADNQSQVHIRVFQGERSMAKDNKFLGDFILDGIANAPKGVPQIEITFDMDSNGILNVHAKDKGTNKEQSIVIKDSGGLSKEEIEKMIQEAKLNEENDKKKKELIEKKNEAESLINQVEKNLEEYGDKISEEDKDSIKNALEDLKLVKDSDDVFVLNEKIENLHKTSQKLGEAIYKVKQNSESDPEVNNSSSNNEESVDI